MAGRREFVAFAVEKKLSRRCACRLVKVSRRRLKYRNRIDAKNVSVLAKLKTLSVKHPSYGVRMLTAKLRRAGFVINPKRVRRLCLKNGLLLKRKRRRKRRGIGVGVPCKAMFPNHVWAYDFVEDRTKTGRKLRILTIIDEFTRRCIEIEVEHRMNSKYVGQVLLKCFATHGVPEFIRSDNGSEFIAKSLMRFMNEHDVKPFHIEPGSPWQNGFDERFNGTYRTDCANQHVFHSVIHSRVISKSFKQEYNHERPHSSLKYQTPDEFFVKWKKENARTASTPTGV